MRLLSMRSFATAGIRPRFLLVALVVLLPAGLLAAEPPATQPAPAATQPAPAATRPADESRIVARVNGKEIRMSEFSQTLNRWVMAARLGPDSGIPVPEIQKTVLDRMIAIILVNQKAAELNLTVTPEEVEARVNGLKAQVGDPADFRMMLAIQSLTEDTLREQFKSQILAEKLLDAEVFTKMEVPEADVKAYYRQHGAELTQPERARVRQIFVALRGDMSAEARTAARAKIDDVKKRLDAGEEFGTVAIEVSEDRSAASGGDLGWIRKEEVEGPFQLVAFTTPVGKVSDVVATDYGYLILQVMERQDARPMTLDEARPSVVEALKDERVPKAVNDYIAGLRARAQVETYLSPP